MSTHVFYRICLAALLIFSTGFYQLAHAERISIVDEPVPPNTAEARSRAGTAPALPAAMQSQRNGAGTVHARSAS